MDTHNLKNLKDLFPKLQDLKDPQKEKIAIDEWTNHGLKANEYILESYKYSYQYICETVCMAIGSNIVLVYIILRRLHAADTSNSIRTP